MKKNILLIMIITICFIISACAPNLEENRNETLAEENSTSVVVPESSAPETNTPSIPESSVPPASEPNAPTTSEPKPPATSEPKPPSTSEPKPPATSEPKPPATSEPKPPATSEPKPPATSEPKPPATSEPNPPTTSEPNPPSSSIVTIQVGNKTFTATLYDNDAANAFKAKLPMTLNMIELNGNEKYYDLPDSLPTSSERVGNIENGDLMLYGSRTLVLFYESFSTSYSYTRLGYIDDPSGLAAALGSGNVTVSFRLGN